MLCEDPARWRRGYGRAALLAVAASEGLAGVEWLIAGIQSRHVASQRCAAAPGFVPASLEPEREGMVSWIRRTEKPACRLPLAWRGVANCSFTS